MVGTKVNGSPNTHGFKPENKTKKKCFKVLCFLKCNIYMDENRSKIPVLPEGPEINRLDTFCNFPWSCIT